ncbi:hypothetical protein GQ53DRAFT_432608 [Thozetella sp. PMI_491]|nr:hypothetical protein GQ53DRAFT_432608 [Thozetella sp. PMI_491]
MVAATTIKIRNLSPARATPATSRNIPSVAAHSASFMSMSLLISLLALAAAWWACFRRRRLSCIMLNEAPVNVKLTVSPDSFSHSFDGLDQGVVHKWINKRRRWWSRRE